MKKNIQIPSLLSVPVVCKWTGLTRKEVHRYLASYDVLHKHSGTDKISSQQLVPFQVARSIFAQAGIAAEYFEMDKYVNPSLMMTGKRRIPVVSIMGHISHGKTTLLDQLQASTLAEQEAGRITQSIRAFDVPLDCGDVDDPEAERVTFIDTPGHKVFVETRLHGQVVSDMILVLIALDEGLQSQTLEVLQTAKEYRRHCIIAFNKVDLYTDPLVLSQRLNVLVRELELKKIAVKPVVSPEEAADAIDKHAYPAMCISGLYGINLQHLRSTIRAVWFRQNPRSDAKGALQATIIESQQTTKKEGITVSTIVRSGKAKQGIWFIADRNYGRITRVCNQWGKLLPYALPGYPATLHGFHIDGCPGVGTNVLEVSGEREARRIVKFRWDLLWFVERFTQKLYLLRPEGKDTSFRHVGNFGQIKVDDSTEFRMVYGGTGIQETSDIRKQADEQREKDKKTDSNEPPRKAINVSLAVDNWHSARMLTRELSLLSTERAYILVVAIDIGDVTVNCVNKAAATRSKALYCFRAKCVDAQADYVASERKVTIVKFDVFIDLLQHAKDLVDVATAEWQQEQKSVHQGGFASSFVP